MNSPFFSINFEFFRTRGQGPRGRFSGPFALPVEGPRGRFSGPFTLPGKQGSSPRLFPLVPRKEPENRPRGTPVKVRRGTPKGNRRTVPAACPERGPENRPRGSWKGPENRPCGSSGENGRGHFPLYTRQSMVRSSKGSISPTKASTSSRTVRSMSSGEGPAEPAEPAVRLRTASRRSSP